MQILCVIIFLVGEKDMKNFEVSDKDYIKFAKRVLENCEKPKQEFFTSRSRDGFLWDGKTAKNIDLKYAKQVYEIARARYHLNRLDSLSCLDTNETFEKTIKYCHYLNHMLMVYEAGKDNETFDKNVKELNDFICAHIVKRPVACVGEKRRGFKMSWTFREFGREDEAKKEYDENGVEKSRDQKRREMIERNENIYKYSCDLFNREQEAMSK